MKANEQTFWQTYLSGLKLHVAIAHYTKVPPSWNEDDYIPDVNKLYWIEEGEGYLKVGDHKVLPKPGELCLLPADVRQSYGTTSDNTFGKYWCHFTAKVGSFNLFELLKTPITVQVQDSERVREAFRRLVHYHNSTEWTAAIHVQSAMLDLIAAFVEHADPITVQAPASGAMDKMNVVLAYIDEHLSDSLTVDQLAQLVHFHPNYFIRLFKNTTGLSPIQYVNHKRMDKAKQMLAFTNMSVSAIAETLTMDAPYFSRLFKEYTALSPTDFRELAQAGAAPAVQG